MATQSSLTSSFQEQIEALRQRLAQDLAELATLIGGYKPTIEKATEQVIKGLRIPTGGQAVPFSPPHIAEEKPFREHWIINYPQKMFAPFPSGRGVNMFDFRKGTIILYDGTQERFADTLESTGFDSLKTLAMVTDAPAILELIYRTHTTQKVPLTQFTILSAAVIPFDSLRIILPNTCTFLFVATTALYNWRIEVPTLAFSRYSSGTTSDSFTPVQWRAITTALSSPLPQFTDPFLYVPNCARKSVIVFNLGSNNMNVNIQGSLDGQNWADDPQTGASTSVPAGSSAGFVTEIPYILLRLRVQSSTAGAPTNYVAHFTGISA